MRYEYVLALTTCLSISSCKPSESKKSGGQQTANSTSTPATTNDPASPAGAIDPGTANTYYTGFDGTNDYSLLLNGRREYSVSDTSIAKVETVEVTLSTKLLDEMVAARKKSNPKFDDVQFKKCYPKKITAYKITPLKAGTTDLASKRKTTVDDPSLPADCPKRNNGSGNHGEGVSSDPWKSKGSLKLVVNSYKTENFNEGKKRYTTDGGGLLKACKSCHESGAEGAPSHQLGKVMLISDAQVLQWVTTGKVANRVATIPHSWEFSDAAKQGIVPYLRSLMTRDVEELSRLEFEERFAEIGAVTPIK